MSNQNQCMLILFIYFHCVYIWDLQLHPGIYQNNLGGLIFPSKTILTKIDHEAAD